MHCEYKISQFYLQKFFKYNLGNFYRSYEQMVLYFASPSDTYQ